MKYFAALCFLALASAASIHDEPIPIVRQHAEVNFDGSFQHSYETGHGISVQEQGILKNAGQKDAEAAEVTGSFEYTGDDGAKYAVHYIANEFGFQPEAAHLPVAPTPPPIPAQIQRALDWIAAHPQPAENEVKIIANKRF